MGIRLVDFQYSDQKGTHARQQIKTITLQTSGYINFYKFQIESPPGYILALAASLISSGNKNKFPHLFLC